MILILRSWPLSEISYPNECSTKFSETKFDFDFLCNIYIFMFTSFTSKHSSAFDFSKIMKLRYLRCLNLSCIDAINGQLACRLMQMLAGSSSSLSTIKMTSCNIDSLPDSFIEYCTTCRSLCHVDLSFNGLSKSNKTKLSACWRQKRLQNATSIIDGDFCIVSTENFKLLT